MIQQKLKNKTVIVYFHGFLSTSKATTVIALRDFLHLAENVEVVALDYDYCDSYNTICKTDELINQIIQLGAKKIILCGNSFGGFIAHHFAEKYKLVSILINPVVNIKKSLSKAKGRNYNTYTKTTSILTENDVNVYLKLDVEKNKREKYIIVGLKDDVIDPLETIERYKENTVIQLENEGHIIADKSHFLKQIKKLVLDLE